jgi:hypothetical protein
LAAGAGAPVRPATIGRVAARIDAMIRFRQAIEVVDPEAAIQWARDAGGLEDLADSLALLLVLSTSPDRPRYDAAMARWLTRLQQTVPLPYADRERCARALTALVDGGRFRESLDDIAAVLIVHDQGAAASEVDQFRGRLE